MTFFYFFSIFHFSGFFDFLFFLFLKFFFGKGAFAPHHPHLGAPPARLFVKKSEDGRRRNSLILCILAVLWCKNIFLKRTFINHISRAVSD